MMEITLRTITFVASIVVIFGTGVMLTRNSYPFGTLLLTVHKLLSLVVVISMGVIVFRSLPLSGADKMLYIVTMILCLLAIITGGLVSAFEFVPAAATWFHRIGSWATGFVLMLCIIRLA
ncbi:MAG: hypothetical protein D6B25_13175 [Desulfobulbaceae bacterium]|nr:MAG: hypothetical protein D6B25_13175 [Desulfobulbaceae bacterium]